jgi:hypothetical protein
MCLCVCVCGWVGGYVCLQRFVYINSIFERLLNRKLIRFNNNNFLSEKELGFRYYALGYLLVPPPRHPHKHSYIHIHTHTNTST